MATKSKAPEAPSATPPTAADQGEQKKKGGPGRPKGFSTKDSDLFTIVDPQPKDVKIAPQAQNIVNLVAAAGTKGITRKELVAQMDGVVETRQPHSRILSYYQKLISTEKGMVKITSAPEAAKPAETPAA